MIHMNLISLDMIGMMLEDLNKEIHDKLSLNSDKPNKAMDYLVLITQGNVHMIQFLGIEIYNSAVSQNLDNSTVEEQMEMNTRENFEEYIRECIQDELDRLQNINMKLKV